MLFLKVEVVLECPDIVQQALKLSPRASGMPSVWPRPAVGLLASLSPAFTCSLAAGRLTALTGVRQCCSLDTRKTFFL